MSPECIPKGNLLPFLIDTLKMSSIQQQEYPV